jgi:hypothetical protein
MATDPGPGATPIAPRHPTAMVLKGWSPFILSSILIVMLYAFVVPWVVPA